MLSITLFLKIYVFIITSFIGSFLNVLIYRLPLHENWISTRSHCPHCQKKISWWMNIPLLSYFILRAHCYYCHAKISMRYPLVEFLTGITGTCLFQHYWLQLNSPGLFFFHFSVFALLLVHWFIDLDHHLLLDKINLTLLFIIGAFAIFQFSWEHWLLGGLLGFLGPLSITYLFYVVRHQVGMGGGDIKLYGIFGLYFGPYGILQTLVLSSLLGVAIASVLIVTKKMDRKHPFAFGPAIILSGLIQFHFPQFINYLFSFLTFN